MNSPTAETTETTSVSVQAPSEPASSNLLKESIEIIPGLVRVGSQDIDRLTGLLKDAWRIDELWDDEARANPGLWFMSHYVNPSNMIFDIHDGAGMIAFIRTVPGWLTQVYFAGWRKEGFRAREQWRTAAQVMMLVNDLRVVHGFIKLDNKLSQRAATSMGMRYRGVISGSQWYNGVPRATAWYEIDEVGVGLKKEIT